MQLFLVSIAYSLFMISFFSEVVVLSLIQLYNCFNGQYMFSFYMTINDNEAV